MKSFEILPHTADIGIRAYGTDLEELFRNCLKGMAEIQAPDVETIKPASQRAFNIKSSDQQALLVDFLNEALYLGQINQEVYFDVQLESLTETKAKGKFLGVPIQRLSEDIKAATFHGLEIKKTNKGILVAEILFDV